MSSILKDDIQDILSDSNISWHEMQDSTILITGATGLIGGLLIHALSAANKEHNLNIKIIAHGRNMKKGLGFAQEFGVKFIAGDIREPLLFAGITDKIDYIFHCAAITKSADMASKPIAVITTSVDGTRNILKLARQHNCRSLVYLSSMEIYGQTKLREVVESDLGYLDLSKPRSSYPESKRFCEMLCTAFFVQYATPVKIARLALTFGAGKPNNESDTRVANQFAKNALAGKNIELHTLGNSIANCCYTSDAVRGLITILLKGSSGEAYNIANPNASATIREMAEFVANEVCGGTIKVVVNVPQDIEKRGYAPDVTFMLNINKLKALGWKPKHGLVEMYRRMLADRQERQTWKNVTNSEYF